MPPKNSMSADAVERLVAQRVADAMATYEANRNNGGAEGSAPPRGCSYKEFMNCKPEFFKGTEGAIGLVHWCEKLESVFRINGCAENCKVKYATCTLQGGALTWWNAFANAVGIDAAYQISWDELKRKMEDKYCPRNEIQKLEVEFWHLKVKNYDMETYTNRFQELASLSPTMVTPEFKRIDRYVWGLPPQVQGNVTSAEPANIDTAIRLAHNLVDQIVRRNSGDERMTNTRDLGNKRKWSEGVGRNQGNPQVQKIEPARVYTAGQPAKIGYVGNKPLLPPLYSSSCRPLPPTLWQVPPTWASSSRL